MAEPLQVVSASMHLANAAVGLCRLVKRISQAQEEARKWLDQARTVRRLARQIKNEVRTRERDRQNGMTATDDELKVERCLTVSLRRFGDNLVQMQLNILGDMSLRDFKNTLPVRLKLLYNTPFIRSQQDDLSWEIQSISVAFHLLHSQDSRRDRALLVEIATILRDRLGPGNQGRQAVILDDDASRYETAPGSRRVSEAEEVPAGLEWPDDNLRDPRHSTYMGTVTDSTSDSESEPDPGTPGRSRTEVLNQTESSLMIAVKRHRLKSVKNLLSTYPTDEIQVYDEDDWTVLHHAVLKGDPELLRALLEREELRQTQYIDHKNRQTYTALMDAAGKADRELGAELVQILLDCGCDVNVEADKRRTAIHFLADRPQTPHSKQTMKRMLDKGVALEPVMETLGSKRLASWSELQEKIKEAKPPGKKHSLNSLRGKLTG